MEIGARDGEIEQFLHGDLVDLIFGSGALVLHPDGR